MPLFGRKSHENPDISSPADGRRISVAQPLVTQPAITSDPQDPSAKLSNSNEPISKEHVGILEQSAHEHNHTYPPTHLDPAHVAQPNVDPGRGVGAGPLPPGASPPGPMPGPSEWQKPQGEEATRVVIVEKMPFKDQVKAWAKVHRGTILRDREQKELGQKILAGEVPPQ